MSPERRLVGALLALTFVTGLVDAVSFLGLGHVFTANMTGNIVLLGFAVAGAGGLSVMGPLPSLLGFLAGAVLGGRLGLSMLTVTRGCRIFTAGMLETVLLFSAAVVAMGLDPKAETPSGRLTAVIVLTAAAMGMRIATVRRLAVLDMSTTVVTLTLGGFAAESTLAGGTNPRLGRRVGAVLLMLAGAAAGVLLLRHALVLPFLVSGVATLGAWIYAGVAITEGVGLRRT